VPPKLNLPQAGLNYIPPNTRPICRPEQHFERVIAGFRLAGIREPQLPWRYFKLMTAATARMSADEVEPDL